MPGVEETPKLSLEIPLCRLGILRLEHRTPEILPCPYSDMRMLLGVPERGGEPRSLIGEFSQGMTEKGDESLATSNTDGTGDILPLGDSGGIDWTVSRSVILTGNKGRESGSSLAVMSDISGTSQGGSSSKSDSRSLSSS